MLLLRAYTPSLSFAPLQDPELIDDESTFPQFRIVGSNRVLDP